MKTLYSSLFLVISLYCYAQNNNYKEIKNVTNYVSSTSNIKIDRDQTKKIKLRNKQKELLTISAIEITDLKSYDKTKGYEISYTINHTTKSIYLNHEEYKELTIFIEKYITNSTYTRKQETKINYEINSDLSLAFDKKKNKKTFEFIFKEDNSFKLNDDFELNKLKKITKEND